MPDPTRATITKPGIYLDIPAADYFRDPMPAPSLTQSLAKLLLDRSPLHAWHAHPRLNPDWRPDDPTKFDVGNAAHKLLIGRGKEIVVLEGFDNWMKADAKKARAAALAEGKHAILGKMYARADRMVKAAREQLDLRELPALFRAGNGEVVTAWQEGGLWFRQMIDWLSEDRRMIVDFKTTDMNAAPHALARKMVTDGWQIQAAMAERGLNVLDPQNAGRRRYLFIVQETERPYCLSVAEIGEAALTIGRKQLVAPAQLWRRCIETNRWPGYSTEIVVPEFPGYAETAWLEREETEFYPDLIMAG